MTALYVQSQSQGHRGGNQRHGRGIRGASGSIHVDAGETATGLFAEALQRYSRRSCANHNQRSDRKSAQPGIRHFSRPHGNETHLSTFAHGFRFAWMPPHDSRAAGSVRRMARDREAPLSPDQMLFEPRNHGLRGAPAVLRICKAMVATGNRYEVRGNTCLLCKIGTS
jgi:hypothetical protein